MKLSEELKARGILDQVSHDELIEKLDQGGLPFYVGYDPTSPSLQIGNLFIIITQMRLQRAGHKPYMLLGGATGMIGDPSGKSDERNLLDGETLRKNVEGQKRQLESFFSFDGDNQLALAVVFAVIGFLVIIVLEKTATKKTAI